MTNGDRPFIDEAVRSAQSQTERCDIIVVVQTSNDWIDGILAASPDVRILRMPLSPPGIARNAAIAAATTEFVAFLDADDAWLPTKTAKQLEFLRSHKADFVGVDHILMREDGVIFAYGTAKFVPMPSAWMVRRDYMLRLPFGDEGSDSPKTEDGTWWTHPQNTTIKHRIAEPLIKYRVRNVSQSTKRTVKRRKLRFAKLSRIPLARPLLLAGSYLVHQFNRRTYYVRHHRTQMSAS
jgi:glycosyltransferase involved in cell wall biosynthesis